MIIGINMLLKLYKQTQNNKYDISFLYLLQF